MTSRSQTLHELLTLNHDELITRCRDKAAKRRGAAARPAPDDRAIATFLEQLVRALRREEASTKPRTEETKALGSTDIGRAAALHGAELLRHGFTLDQVVHDYGDVCQSVTGLAIEQNLSMRTDEFRTLNRCLDMAIADAVAAFLKGRERSRDSQAEISQERMNAFSDEHQRLIDIAIRSFSAVKTGSIGATGATGDLLTHALGELRLLAEQVRPDSGVTPPPHVANPTPDDLGRQVAR